MLLHPSSISSFNRRLGSWADLRLVGSVAVAIAVFVTAEVVARMFCAPYQRLWAYWSPESGANLEAFREHVRAGSPVELLVAGDSTAQSNFAFDVLQNGREEQFQAWNIGTPGAFAQAFRWTILPLLEESGCQPQVLIISFLPEAFSESPAVRFLEARILESPAGRMAQGKFHLGKYLALARLWPALRVWNAEREGKIAEVQMQRGFLLRRRVVDLEREPPESPAFHPLVPERLEVLERLAAWAQTRHVLLIVVVPPRLNTSPQAQRTYEVYRQYLEQLSLRFPLAVLDTTSRPWPAEWFADRTHLNQEGATRLSLLVRDQVAQKIQYRPASRFRLSMPAISRLTLPGDQAARGMAQ